MIMALVLQPYWTLSLSFKDRDQNKGSIQFYIANSVLIADIITSLSTIIIPRVSALSDATLVGWTLNRSAYEDAAPLAAEASDVEKKGMFLFIAANGRPVTLQLPSIKNTLVVDRTDVLNTADLIVSQFIDMVINGVVLGTGRPTSVTGSDITIFNQAYKKHRGSKRG
jgi:hypothetical protein